MNRRILVADDDEAILSVVEQKLTRAGYSVVTAADGQQAWELFQAQPFDLVSTDLMMPRLDGIALIDRIQASAPRVPIIVLTGYIDPATLERLLTNERVRVLQKPLSPFSQMLDLIKQLTNNPDLEIQNTELP